MKLPNWYRPVLVLLSCTVLLFATSTLILGKVRIPKGLSDTATERAWDQALEDLERNVEAKFDDMQDTPTVDQLYFYFLKHDNYSDSFASSSNYDTKILTHTDIPYKLNIVEQYDSSGKLHDYYKTIESDTS